MKLEPGKQYVTACGLITPPLKKLNGFDDMFDIAYGNPLVWRGDGIHMDHGGGAAMLNLVGEYTDPFQCVSVNGSHAIYSRRVDDQCTINVASTDGEWETMISVRKQGSNGWSDRTVKGDFRDELAEIKREELDAWFRSKTCDVGTK